MAEPGESTDSAKIATRNAQKPRITQVMMDKRKFSNPFLNVNFPQMKLGLPVKLGIRVGTVSFLTGFACGYITAVSQQYLIKTVVQKDLEDSQVIKNMVHKALEEYEVELIKSVLEKMLEENKAVEQNKIEKKRN